MPESLAANGIGVLERQYPVVMPDANANSVAKLCVLTSTSGGEFCQLDFVCTRNIMSI